MNDRPQEAFDVARVAAIGVVAALKADMRDTLNGEERSLLARALYRIRDTMDLDSLVYQLEWYGGSNSVSTRVASSAVAEFVRHFTKH